MLRHSSNQARPSGEGKTNREVVSSKPSPSPLPKGITYLAHQLLASFAAAVPITFSLFSLPSPSGRGLGEGLDETTSLFIFLLLRAAPDWGNTEPTRFTAGEKEKSLLWNGPR